MRENSGNNLVNKHNGRQRRKAGRRLLTGVLAFVMVLTGQPGTVGLLPVQAEQKAEIRMITGFASLADVICCEL